MLCTRVARDEVGRHSLLFDANGATLRRQEIALSLLCNRQRSSHHANLHNRLFSVGWRAAMGLHAGCNKSERNLVHLDVHVDSRSAGAEFNGPCPVSMFNAAFEPLQSASLIEAAMVYFGSSSRFNLSSAILKRVRCD